MADERYDSEWKEVKVINGYVLLMVYVGFAIRGLAFLVVTWTTVVLLGGFVSMIDKKDFQRLTLITLIEILWINVSFLRRTPLAVDLFKSLKIVKDLLVRTQLTDNALRFVVAPIRLVVGWPLALVHSMVLPLCILFAIFLYFFGLPIATSLSIYSLVNHDYYGNTDEGRTNMDPAHNILSVLCVAQGALFLYMVFLGRCWKRIVNQVSKGYGFQDDDRAVLGYFQETRTQCIKEPSSIRERNLITHAIELMESKSPSSFLSGTLILDRLLTRQHFDKIKAPTYLVEEKEKQQQHQLDFEDKTGGHMIKKEKNEMDQQAEEKIIVQQHREIERLIGSASCTNILERLLDTLDSRRPHDKKMREAAARIVEHVAGTVRLDQFSRGIQSISSLINSFEEFCQLRPHQSSSSTDSTTTRSAPSSKDVDQSSPKALHGYKDVVLTGLHILWSLAGSEGNCVIISNTKHLISKIMAPVSCNLVHRACHSEWSTKVSERSMGVMLRMIVTAKGDTRADLHQQISSDEGAITTMERIVTCEGCKGGELQMKTMQILTELCMDKSDNRGHLTKMLISVFVNGDNSDSSTRKTAGKTLVVLFLSSKSVATLLPNGEHEEFIGDLAKILLQVVDDDTCRESAAEILEHLCISYTENEQYLSTLKNTMTDLMPKVLREILSGLTEEGKPGYARSDTDVESQVHTNNDKNNSTSSIVQNKHHKLHVALISLCVTACDTLHLDLDTISLEGDQGESVVFSLAMKMVQLNRDLITAENLKAMKLITRMVITSMAKLRDHGTVIKRDDLQNLMNRLSSISEAMLDLEGCMVFATWMTKLPATADTLDSLVKQAWEIYGEMDKDSEIVLAN